MNDSNNINDNYPPPKRNPKAKNKKTHMENIFKVR